MQIREDQVEIVEENLLRKQLKEAEAKLERRTREFHAAVEVAVSLYMRDTGPSSDEYAEEFVLEKVLEKLGDLQK